MTLQIKIQNSTGQFRNNNTFTGAWVLDIDNFWDDNGYWIDSRTWTEEPAVELAGNLPYNL